MLVSIIRYVKGFVDFRVKGRSPERFLNICAQRGIYLWNSRPADAGMQARMFVSDYKSVRHAARRAGVRTEVLARHGLPFFIARYRGRAGLPVGAVLGAVLLVVLSRFVWNVQIIGAQTVGEQRLRTLLAESGVDIGAYIKGIDTGQAKRDILLKAEEIGWMSVNLHGCRADVEIREKSRKPVLEDNALPCNIKASADGVITDIIVQNGDARVKKGSGVAKGDLLVSGVSPTKQNTVRFLRAKAEVWADVMNQRQLFLPKESDYYSVSENKTDRYRLSVLGAQFPCSLSFRVFANTAYTREASDWQMNGVDLPLGLLTETAHEIRREHASESRAQAQSVFKADLLLYEVFEKGESRIVKKEMTVSETTEGYCCSAAYVFNENIAESVDFSAEE